MSAVAIAAVTLVSCGGSDSGDSAASEADVCGGMQKIADAFTAGDAATSTEEIKAAINSFAKAIGDFAEIAPSEIKSEADTLAEATQLLADADGELTDEVAAAIDDDKYDAAGEKFDEFALETCDITLE